MNELLLKISLIVNSLWSDRVKIEQIHSLLNMNQGVYDAEEE